MSRLIRGCIVLFVISSLSLSAASAQSSTWTMTQATLLSDVVGSNADLHNVTMSPDGQTIAWGAERQVCVYHVDSSEQNCADAPPIFVGFHKYSYLSWSPDGKTLVFADDFFTTFNDSDIWTLDVATNTIQDRTDDHIIRGVINPKPGEVALIDYLPTWNPSNGDLYFFRSIHSPDSTSMQLELLPLTRTDPKPVGDFSLDLPTFSVYSSAPISPDGKQMAIVVMGNDKTDAHNGIWIYDLVTSALTQVTTLDDLKIGLPAWADASSYYPQTLQWVGNKGLILLSQNVTAFSPGISQMAHYIDLSTKKITPLTDFSSVPDAVTLLNATADEPQSVGHVVRAGVVTPDANSYLFLGTDSTQHNGYIWLQALPPDGSAPTQIGTIDNFQITPAASAQPAISTDGTHALLFGYWLTLQPPGT